MDNSERLSVVQAIVDRLIQCGLTVRRGPVDARIRRALNTDTSPLLDAAAAGGLSGMLSHDLFADAFGPEDELDAVLPELVEMDADQLREQLSRLSGILEERAEEHRAKERARPYNQPEALADIEHWSRAACWALDEAVALSFGRNPYVVTFDLVAPYIQESRFALAYARLQDLVERGAAAGQLAAPIEPVHFIEWCDRWSIEFHHPLRQALEQRGAAVNWREAYQSSQEWIVDLNIELDEVTALANHLQEQITRLREERKANKTADKEAVGPKERSSVLKLILGMAIAGYGFDPRATRCSTVKEILSDMHLKGISLGEDTVRKYLNESREFAPDQPPDL